MPAVIGLALAVVAFVVYWLSNRAFDAGRGDFFYLADAFVHGRVWIESALGPNDVIYRDGHVYVPFAPFPALVLAPLVALIGPVTADQWESGINAGLAAAVVLVAWWTAGRIGVDRIRERVALVLLLGFSTQVWWVTTRGGVWHTGHLVAMILTLLLIAELFGKARPVLLGLLVGAAFLTRAPVAFATPAVALWFLVASPSRGAWPLDRRAPGPAAVARVGAPGRGPGAAAGCSSSGTTSRASAPRWSPGTRWPRCPSGWRTSGSWGCSPWPTCG